MHSRTIQLGDLQITRMGLGTNRLTATPDNISFLRAAVEAGIGMVDTAHLYTGGASEDTVGQALSPFDGEHMIATKGGYRPGEGRPDVLRAQIENSLRFLRTPRIPLWYLHRVDPETPLETSLSVVREFVDAGHVGLVGISDVNVDQSSRRRHRLLRARGRPVRPVFATARFACSGVGNCESARHHRATGGAG